jgi:hypothetical protein
VTINGEPVCEIDIRGKRLLTAALLFG